MSDTTPLPQPADPEEGHGTETTLPQGRMRRGLASRGLAAVVLLAVGAAAGVGIGRATWTRSASGASSNASGQTTTPGTGTGGSGSGDFPGGFGSGGFGNGFGSGGFPGGFGSGSSGQSSNSNASDGPTDAASIARDVDPGVVDITTTVAGGEAAGTGMVLTADGEVLTNNHVIDGATSISVRDVGNGKTYQATVVGYDRTQDIAVLQLQNAGGLTTVTTASNEPSAGATVVGIGNAGGTGGTPSYAGGSITATNKSITAGDEYDGTSERLTGLLGTDADIQSGDSGGPLVNASGEVVGMDTAASSGYNFDQPATGASATQGFAIPILTALRIADQIESGDSSSTVHSGDTAKLGVYISSDSNANGAVVEQAESGSPAADAGIAAGDVITSVNGTTIRDANALSDVMTELSPGQTVTVTATTPAGSTRSVKVTLGKGAPQ
jgi:S1-C subfamily serine protease